MQLSLPSFSPVEKFPAFRVTAGRIWRSTTVNGRYDRQRFFGACPNSNRIDGKTPNPFLG
jgi:hypothetical protein